MKKLPFFEKEKRHIIVAWITVRAGKETRLRESNTNHDRNTLSCSFFLEKNFQVSYSYLLVPPGAFKSLMADKNCMVETKRQMRLSERVTVVRVTEKLETLTNSLALIGVTRLDETPEAEVRNILALSSLEATDTVGVVLFRKTRASKAIIMESKVMRARETNSSLNPFLRLLSSPRHEQEHVPPGETWPTGLGGEYINFLLWFSCKETPGWWWGPAPVIEKLWSLRGEEAMSRKGGCFREEVVMPVFIGLESNGSCWERRGREYGDEEWGSGDETWLPWTRLEVEGSRNEDAALVFIASLFTDDAEAVPFLVILYRNEDTGFFSLTNVRCHVVVGDPLYDSSFIEKSSLRCLLLPFNWCCTYLHLFLCPLQSRGVIKRLLLLFPLFFSLNFFWVVMKGRLERGCRASADKEQQQSWVDGTTFPCLSNHKSKPTDVMISSVK